MTRINLQIKEVPKHHEPICRLEAELLKIPQVDMPIEHAFCSGLYARTMHLPAGAAATGAVHKHECFFVVRSGMLMATTDDEPSLVKAGDMLVSSAGSKRAVYALTDCVLTTFHANPSEVRDPQDIWREFTIPAPALEIEQ